VNSDLFKLLYYLIIVHLYACKLCMVAIVVSSESVEVVTCVLMFSFLLSTPDRNRHVPNRHIPLPITRNIEFVFPSGCSRPVPNRSRNGLGVFLTVPDRFYP
jgi:hypothetical protein